MFEFLKLYAKLSVKPSKDIGLTSYVFPSETIGLYLHVPFCRHFCDFCPYHKLKYDAVLAREYVDLVRREYLLHGRKQFNSLYIGGGTPSGDLEVLKNLLSFLHENVSGEIALEVHPLDASVEKLREMKALGVNYISLGVQSFNDAVLKHFGRDHTAKDNFLALANVLDAGFDFIDVDLVFDPLSFSGKAAQSDLEKVMKLSPQQISVYPMMRFSYTKFSDTRNSSRRELMIFDKLDEIAEKNGYKRDTLWTYLRKNLNRRYTSVAREFYLGLGLSASTYTGELFATNTFSLARYRESITENKPPIGSLFQLSTFQGALYYSFWALYTGQLDFSKLNRYFPKANKKLRFLLESLRVMGYLTRKDELYLLTPRGRKKLHCIEEWLTYAYIDPLWRKLRSESTQI